MNLPWPDLLDNPVFHGCSKSEGFQVLLNLGGIISDPMNMKHRP